MLAQAVIANVRANNQAPTANHQRGNVTAAGIRDFLRMNPPEFYGSGTDEDPQLNLEEVRKITNVMDILEEESVELAFYILKDIAYDWVVSWRKDKDVALMTWQVFQDVFLD